MEPAQILLIEDNPADVLLIKLALKEYKIAHTLLEFRSGLDAVNQLCGPKARPAEPQAIILDLNTPCTDGFETLGKLQQQFPQAQISILTSSRAQADKRRAAQRGVGYLEKPSELNVFLETVGEAVKEMLAKSSSEASKSTRTAS